MYRELTFDEPVMLRKTSLWSMRSVLFGTLRSPGHVPLTVHADRFGVSADGKLLIPRHGIRQAHVREACDKHFVKILPPGTWNWAGVTMPALPLTVELETDARLWALEVSDLEQATRLMSPLGLPVNVVQPDFISPFVTKADRGIQRKLLLCLMVLGVAIHGLRRLIGLR